MLDSFHSSPRACARISRSWLREPIDAFLKHLAAQHYSRGTMRLCSYRLLAFGEFMARQGVGDLAALPAWIDPFVAQVCCRDDHRGKLRLALLRFIRFLHQKQVIPAPEPLPTSAPHVDLVEDYLRCRQQHPRLRRHSLELMRW